MELPQKIKQPEERMMNGVLVVTHMSPTELKINEILEYLESQKDGKEPFIQHEGHLYDKTGNEVCCEKAKEEPKQIDVEGLLEEWSYNERVDLSPLTMPETRNAVYKRNKEIIKIFKQALQQ